MATSDTQSTYVSRFSPSEDITNFVCDQHDSEDLESLGFNSRVNQGASENRFGSVDSDDPSYAVHTSFTTTGNLNAQITYDSLSSLPCEGITNPYQQGLQNMYLNGGAGETLFGLGDDPRVPGYVGHAATTSDTQLMYDSQPPYEGIAAHQLSL